MVAVYASVENYPTIVVYATQQTLASKDVSSSPIRQSALHCATKQCAPKECALYHHWNAQCEISQETSNAKVCQGKTELGG